MKMCLILCLVGAMYVLSGGESVLQLFPEYHQDITRLENEIRSNREALNGQLNELNSTLSLHKSVTTGSKAYYWGKVGAHQSCHLCNLPFMKNECVPSSAYSDGKYTVPYDGVYVFSWTLTMYAGRCFNAKIYFDEIGNILGSYADSYSNADVSSTTCTVIRNVTKGTVVTIKATENGRCDYLDSGLFSAFRLF